MRLPQDSSTRTIRGGPTSGTYTLLPRSSFIPQSLLRDDGLLGYGGESGRVMTHTSFTVPSSHVYFLEVLRGVLYPEAHNNGLKK